jgi:hypothetical protein
MCRLYIHVAHRSSRCPLHCRVISKTQLRKISMMPIATNTQIDFVRMAALNGATLLQQASWLKSV